MSKLRRYVCRPASWIGIKCAGLGIENQIERRPTGGSADAAPDPAAADR
ncbi:MAG: hypothetical protein QOE74_3456 [Mycobacterium sp.]|jgi:hypothetical protein|nr:hypothetical protein [Mycobacterium sp.]